MKARETYKTKGGNRIFRPTVGTYISPSYTYRRKKGGRQAYFQLGTNLAKAKTLADKIEVFLKQPENTLEDAIARFNPSKVQLQEKAKVPTVGELIQAYVRTSEHSSSTKRTNVGSMRTIAAFVQGMDRTTSKGRTKEMVERKRRLADSLRLDRITVAKLAEFRQSLLKEAGSDGIQQGKAKTTFNSHKRNAGQLLSRKARVGYDDSILLPKENPFEEMPDSQEPKRVFTEKINAGELISAAEKELQGSEPDVFTAFVLALFAGLGKGEMDKLPWEQVDLEAQEITIGPSRFTSLKTTNRPGVVPLSDYAAKILADYKALEMARVAERRGFNPDGYFVFPGASPDETTDRYRSNPVFNRLVAWLRDHGLADRTPIHSLRKMAESNIYRQTRSVEEAARFARHTPQVARDHYIARDKTVAVNFR